MNVTKRALLRIECHLSQLQLSRKAQISLMDVIEWEHGVKKLRPEQVKRLAEVLHGQSLQPPFGSIEEVEKRMQ
jgi:DNA-binding transcriptional regulator YiaG